MSCRFSFSVSSFHGVLRGAASARDRCVTAACRCAVSRGRCMNGRGGWCCSSDAAYRPPCCVVLARPQRAAAGRLFFFRPWRPPPCGCVASPQPGVTFAAEVGESAGRQPGAQARRGMPSWILTRPPRCAMSIGAMGARSKNDLPGHECWLAWSEPQSTPVRTWRSSRVRHPAFPCRVPRGPLSLMLLWLLPVRPADTRSSPAKQ